MRVPDRPRPPEHRTNPATRSSGWFGQDEPDPGSPEVYEPVVRPFMVTEGRTTPLVDGLRIETLVQASRAALSAPLRFEQRTVVILCQAPHSIAEIATVLRVPVGVATVVVSDLASREYVTVRQEPELSTAAIERIRDLVRAL
ncbi:MULTISPECIES: DUF742 domain-containing protein [Nocardia]|uniref:DUF742 domain-containing protein n=1 Tax=Nocardia TaxID=1817 RepID=UPI000D69E134|nr:MULTISPECIES: DUF742 domain-containing protein [Nocardia]